MRNKQIKQKSYLSAKRSISLHHCSIRCTLTPNFLFGFKLCYVSIYLKNNQARTPPVRWSARTHPLPLLRSFQQSRLKAAFRKFYGQYNDLVCPYNLPFSQMLYDMFKDNCLVVLYSGFDYILLRLPDLDF